MIYKMQLSDSFDTMIFPLLEVPIEDKDVSGIASNTTIDGNVFNDYLWLKKQYVQKWSIMCQDEYNRLRGFWTRQFGNAEVPFYRLFYGDNVYEDRNTFTVNGFVQIENDAPLYSPLSLTQLTGNATQKTLSGKNLINITAGSNVSANMTWTITSDTISGTTGSGTATANWSFIQTKTAFAAPLSVGTYTFAIPQALAKLIRVTLYESNTTSHSYQVAIGSTSVTLTTTFTATEYSFEYRVGNGDSDTVSFPNRVQLEAGSTATDFEPYCGGVPSPNPSYPQTINVVSGAQLVQVAGKNLFNFQEFAEDKTRTGGCTRGTATASGNSITITATSNDAYTSYSFTLGLPPIIKVPKNSNMVLSWKTSNTSGTFKGLNYVLGLNKNGGFDIIKNASDISQKCAFNTGDYDTISFRLGVSTAGDSLTYSDIQLEFGTEPSAYEPYQGTQQYEINLGKNLACIETSATKTIGGVPFTIEDGIIKISSGTTAGYTNFYFDSFRVMSGVSSFWMEVSGYTPAPSDNCTYVLQESADGGSTWTNTAQMSFASPSTQHPTLDSSKLYRIRIYAPPSASFNNAQIKFMLEYGSTKTEFAPYFPPIELAGVGEIQPDGLPKYRDGFKYENGTWYIHKEVGKVVLDGSEAWDIASNGNSFHHTTVDAIRMPDRDTIAYAMSNYYTAETYNRVTASTPVIDYGMALSNTANRIVIRNKDCADKTALQTWLSTHNTTVYYALATPTDTAITDSDLIEQLNFVASLYEGVNNIMLIPSAGEQGEIGVKYRLNYEEETDIIPNTPVVLTLSDGGVINACGCRQNIQLIMRETTQGNSES